MEYSAVAAIQRLVRRQGDTEADVAGLAYEFAATPSQHVSLSSTQPVSRIAFSNGLLYVSPFIRVAGPSPDG